MGVSSRQRVLTMLVAGERLDLGGRLDRGPVEPQIRIHDAVVDLAVDPLEPDEVPLALDHPEEDDRLHAGGKVRIVRLAVAVDVAVALVEDLHEALVGDEPVRDAFARDHAIGQDLEEVVSRFLLAVGIGRRGEVGRHGQTGSVKRPGVSVGDHDPVLIPDELGESRDVGAGVEPDLVLVGDPDEDLVEADRIDASPVADEIAHVQAVPENRPELIVGEDTHDAALAALLDDLANPDVSESLVRHVDDLEIRLLHFRLLVCSCLLARREIVSPLLANTVQKLLAALERPFVNKPHCGCLREQL